MANKGKHLNYINLKLIFIGFICLIGCTQPDPLDDDCYLIPETGPCEALIPRYFYDQDAGICKEFIWGGCDGVVPFETMEDCKRGCGE